MKTSYVTVLITLSNLERLDAISYVTVLITLSNLERPDAIYHTSYSFEFRMAATEPSL